MFKIEEEMFSQFQSLDKTVHYLKENSEQIKKYFTGNQSVWFIGSGSSYCIAKAAALILNLRCGIPAYAVASGDLMINFERYKKRLSNSLVVTLSRSGSTSELLYALEKVCNQTDTQCISICSKQNTDVTKYCSLNLEIPWAFDESVCQTRTVSNLYAASVMIAAIINEDNTLIQTMFNLAAKESEFRDTYMPLMKEISRMDWKHTITLADCEASYLMEEGALAFKEICLCNSNFYNVLDMRHGPMVMVDDQTLVILFVEHNDKYVKGLVRDIRSKGAYCLTMGAFSEELDGNAHVVLPVSGEPAASCIFGLYCIQMISYFKAIERGINPDKPDGLQSWIKL